jgi:hypothetical protein
MISDGYGRIIEQGKATPFQTFGPGSLVPDYTLSPPRGLGIMSESVTVDRPTRLSRLLRPEMGRVHWAARREVLVDC